LATLSCASKGPTHVDKQVLANFALFNVICFGILLKKIFFGQLRPIEYEVCITISDPLTSR
jgi:hypothetical protein